MNSDSVYLTSDCVACVLPPAPELPALPEPFTHVVWRGVGERRPDTPIYTADQMRAYAVAALEQAQGAQRAAGVGEP